MITYILIGAAVLVVLLALVIAMQPSEFAVARSLRMSAPPESAFAQVNDLHRFQEWSPWARLDPAAKNTFEGPDAGVGASFAWSGNMNVGQGRMTITDSRPSELVRMRLDFAKPMKGTNTAEFSFKKDGAYTVVKWSMSGKKNFMAKAFGLVMSCDKMVGGQFEKGLENMKSLVESPAKSELATA